MNKIFLFWLFIVIISISVACREDKAPKVKRVITTIIDDDQLHEIIITTSDTAQVTEHYSDCIYCQPYIHIDNPTGNPN